jgi:hypothetical protein
MDDGPGFDSFIILNLCWFHFSVFIPKISKWTTQNKNKLVK